MLAGARQRPGYRARGRSTARERSSKRIHTFIATSALHMEKKLRMTPEQVYEQARLSVRFARKFTDNVEFSPEDGSRSEPRLPLPRAGGSDRGGRQPRSTSRTRSATRCRNNIGQLIRDMLRERIPNSDKAVWSVHCHNDLGMAVANSLAGVMNRRARQIECTINGLGERAGNTSLEEVVMAAKTRRDFFGLDMGIDTTQIVPPPSWSPTSPVFQCSRTRPWSVRTRLRTHPASTRTVCSRRARPTKSCVPRT